MHLIYFDETKNDVAHPHYHIGGVAIEEENLKEIEALIAAIAKDCFDDDRLSLDTELHAAEIFHRKKNFKDWNDFKKRVDVIARFLPILSMSKVKLINIQINANKLHGNQRPDEVAFMYFCERANGIMRGARSLGLLIGDRENDRVSGNLAQSLSSYRNTGTDFQYGTNINHLVDSVHFTHSHLSRFLQLADIYTWISQFRVRNRGSSNIRHEEVLKRLREESIDLFPATYKEWPK